MDAEKCKNCGSDSVVVDFDTNEAVCEACGVVAEEGDDLQHEILEGAEFCHIPCSDEGNHVARAKVLDTLKRMISMLSFGSRISQEAIAVMNDTRKYKKNRNMDAYCAVVIYIAGRRRFLPITAYEIACTFKLNYNEIMRHYRHLVRTAGISIPGHNLNLLVDRFISEIASHLDDLKMFPPPPSPSKKKKEKKKEKKDEKNEEEKDVSERAVFYELPTKEGLMTVMHDVKEFLFHQELHGRAKPMCFVGAVVALGVESKFSQSKAIPMVIEFCKKHNIAMTPTKEYKKLIKRELLKATQGIPGCRDITVSKMARRLPQVLTAWKRVQAIEEKCVEEEEEEEEAPPAPFEEGVAPTPLVVLLQEAGLIGDVTTRKINRGYCPPENYNVSFPKELATYVTPARIKIEGLSSSSESDGGEELEEEEEEEEEEVVLLEKEQEQEEEELALLEEESQWSREVAANSERNQEQKLMSDAPAMTLSLNLTDSPGKGKKKFSQLSREAAANLERNQQQKLMLDAPAMTLTKNLTDSPGKGKKSFFDLFAGKYWEKCGVPGHPGKESFLVDEGNGYGEVRDFFRRKSTRQRDRMIDLQKERMADLQKPRKKPRKQQRVEEEIDGVGGRALAGCLRDGSGVDTGGASLDELLADIEEGQPVKSVGGDDEIERDGLSDIDDTEIDGYIMGPREIVVRAALRGTQLREPPSEGRGREVNTPIDTLDRRGVSEKSQHSGRKGGKVKAPVDTLDGRGVSEKDQHSEKPTKSESFGG
ncbi:hypothetical protein BSKO_03911 [Bryopsis sp. KO-2023]|nr:hypothetical protein BSKO_03911 [Bryopsis sp. KO-2023]